MRIFNAGALVALSLMTAGCSGCAILNPTQGALTATLNDEKALYAAEAAFYGANAAAEAAVDNKLLVQGSPTAVQVADGLAQAHDALNAARAAHKAGDARTYSDKLGAVQEFVASAWKLIPKKEV